MRVDDFIVFGRTAPEVSKKYGKSVCMAGYSPELKSMMRVYPLDVKTDVKTRCSLVMDLERNNKDSRLESWALKKRGPESILSISSKVGDDIIKPILDANVVESISYLNERRLSLGILKPDSFEIVMKQRKNIQNPDQLLLFDDYKDSTGFKTAGDYFRVPYISFNDGVNRCIQLREWGVYELIRRSEIEGIRVSAKTITERLYIKSNSTAYFVVGNIHNFRNIWLVIKVFVFKNAEIQDTLF